MTDTPTPIVADTQTPVPSPTDLIVVTKLKWNDEKYGSECEGVGASYVIYEGRDAWIICGWHDRGQEFSTRDEAKKACQREYERPILAAIDTTETVKAIRRDALSNKVAGLEADLNEAVKVAYRHGADDWVKRNHRLLYEEISNDRDQHSPAAILKPLLERHQHLSAHITSVFNRNLDILDEAEITGGSE